MKLIKQTGPECLITSLAMVLNLSEKTFVTSLRPQFKDPVHLHIQEVQDYCWTKHKLAFMWVAYNPYGSKCPDPKVPSVRTEYQLYPNAAYRRERMSNYLKDNQAILIFEQNLNIHACAWDGHKVYNPIGRIEDINYLTLNEAWILIRE